MVMVIVMVMVMERLSLLSTEAARRIDAMVCGLAILTSAEIKASDHASGRLNVTN